jgi:hypothetical protein
MPTFARTYLFALPILAVAWRIWEPARIVLVSFIAVLLLWFSQSQEQIPSTPPPLPLIFVLAVVRGQAGAPGPEPAPGSCTIAARSWSPVLPRAPRVRRPTSATLT